MSEIAKRLSDQTVNHLISNFKHLAQSAKTGSLIEYTQPCRVEPITLIDEKIVHLSYTNELLQTITSIFSGYYLQAIALSVNVGKIDVLQLFDNVNPNRDIERLVRDKGTNLLFDLMSGVDPSGFSHLFSSESFKESLIFKYQMPSTNLQLVIKNKLVSLEDDQNADLNLLKFQLDNQEVEIDKLKADLDRIRKSKPNGMTNREHTQYIERLDRDIIRAESKKEEIEAKIRSEEARHQQKLTEMKEKERIDSERDNARRSQQEKDKEEQRRQQLADKAEQRILQEKDKLEQRAYQTFDKAEQRKYEEEKREKEKRQLEEDKEKLNSQYRVNVKDAIREAGTPTNIVVGKLLSVEVANPEGGNRATFPILVRIMGVTTASKIIVDILSSGLKNSGLKERYHRWREGELSLIKDLMFSQDLINEHKRRILKDSSNIYLSSTLRSRKNRIAAILTGRPSIATASNIAIISESTKKELERAIRSRLDNFRSREKLFSEIYLMLLVVVDPDWDTITIYHRSIEHASTFTARDLKSTGGGKSTGPDIGDLLKAYSLGQNPTSAF